MPPFDRPTRWTALVHRRSGRTALGRRPRGRLARWRMRLFTRLAALICLSLAAWSVVQIVAPAPPEVVSVVAATADLPSGRLLGPGDLEVRRRPVPVDGPVLTDPAAALGRRLAAPVARGELLTTTRLVPRSVGEGLPADFVALHVSVIDPRSLDLVTPGVRVTLHDPAGVEVARDVLVLSLDEAPTSSTLSLSAAPSRPGVVVAVPRDLVPKLLAGSEVGGQGPTLHLVLETNRS